MALDKAREYLAEKGYADRILLTEENTATVALAAAAFGVGEDEIAKTLSFLMDDGAVLVVMEGTARTDNRKFKDTFHTKAKMVPFDSVEELIGHAAGGVCPFGVNEGVKVYLDESLKKHERVYPAAGNDHSAVDLTLAELEEIVEPEGWVDIAKEQ